MYRLNYESLYIEVEMQEVGNTSVQIITFAGKFNHQNAYTISRNLQDLFKDEVYDLILNLSDLKYINSVGLAIILSMVKIVDQHSGKFVIGGVHNAIEQIIQLVELPEKVQICSSIGEALDTWK